jgi:hypothetical protein
MIPKVPVLNLEELIYLSPKIFWKVEERTKEGMEKVI